MVKLSKDKKHFPDKIKPQTSSEEEQTILEIAHKIAELRKIQSITQEELAKKIGTTQSTIARIEAGKQNLTINYIQKIASALKRNIRLKFLK